MPATGTLAECRNRCDVSPGAGREVAAMGRSYKSRLTRRYFGVGAGHARDRDVSGCGAGGVWFAG